MSILRHTHTRTHAWNLKFTYTLKCIPTRTQPHTHLKPSSVLLLDSAQYIQVYRWGLGQIEEQTVYFFNVESHVRFSLPAAQHQVIYFFRTRPGALEHPALGYTLYHLQRKKDKTSRSRVVLAPPIQSKRIKLECSNSSHDGASAGWSCLASLQRYTVKMPLWINHLLGWWS